MDSRWKPLIGIFALALGLTLISSATGFPPHDGHEHSGDASSAHVHDASTDGTTAHTEEYPVHSDFAVIVNGVKWTHADFGFTCLDRHPSLNGAPDLEVSDHVAHVKTAGSSWREFFATLSVTLTPSCISTPSGRVVCNAPDGSSVWQMVDEGTLVPFNPDRPIQDLGRVLFWYGPPASAPKGLAFNDVVTSESCVHEGKCPEKTVDEERC